MRTRTSTMNATPRKTALLSGLSLGLLPGLLLGFLSLSSCSGGDADSTPEETASAEDAQGVGSGLETLETGYDLSKLNANQAAKTTDAKQPTGVERKIPATTAPNTAGSDGGRIGMSDGEREIDFGEVRQGDRKSHIFQMVSEGESELVISRIKPSCGCTVAEVMLLGDEGETVAYNVGSPIPSGQKFQIKTDLKSDGRSGKMQTQVSLYTNDPRGVFNLKLKADVEPVLITEPATTLNFGRITSSQTVTETMVVRTAVLEPFLLTVDDQYIQEPLQVKLEPVDPTPEGKSTKWNITVTLGPDIPEGLRNYPLIFWTDVPVPYPSKNSLERNDKPTFSTRSYVQAQVSGLVSATPAFISFGMLRPGQPLERTVRIQCHDDFQLSPNAAITVEGLQGQEFQYADAMDFEVVAVDGGKALDLKLKLKGMPEDLNGSFGGIVNVDVGHPLKDKLMVRFSGVCRQGLPAGHQPPPQAPPADPHAGHNHAGNDHAGHDH